MDMTLHIIVWLGPHNMPVLHGCTSLDLHAMGHGEAVNKGCVIGAAEADVMQGSKNLFSNTRQGGSKRKVLVAKVAV